MEGEIGDLRQRIESLKSELSIESRNPKDHSEPLQSQFRADLEFMETSNASLSEIYSKLASCTVVIKSILSDTAPNMDEFGDFDELSADIKEQTRAILDELNDLLGSENSKALIAREALLRDGLCRVEQKVEEIEGIYSEFVEIREMLDKAFVEESNFQYRLVNEFPALRESVKKISHELHFIKEERQKLKLKLRKEYPSIPLEEIFNVSETPNTTWSDLVGNIRLAQISL